MYKLRHWIDETKLNENLSFNKNAIEYLENHTHLINMNILTNENAIHIIEKSKKYIDKRINYNKNAVNFLRNNRQFIDYDIMCEYEHGVTFIEELLNNNEIDKINWFKLSANPAMIHILSMPEYSKYTNPPNFFCNKNGKQQCIKMFYEIDTIERIDKLCHISSEEHLIDFIEENIDRVSWNHLAFNSAAIHILMNNLDKIQTCHDNLRYNKNSFIILLTLGHVFDNNKFYDKQIIFEYFDHCEKNNTPFVCIDILSLHGYTDKHMNYLMNNHQHIHYDNLSENPNIFEYDYKRMQQTRQLLPWYNHIIHTPQYNI